MSSSPSNRLKLSIYVFRFGFSILLVLGIVMLLEGPLKIMSHDYESPSYHHHHHHLSHVLAINLGLVSLWWAVTLFLLARNREAMQQKWAHRLFGFPVLVLAVIGAVTAYYLYWTIDVHDEVTHAAVLGVANGSVLCVIALMCFSLLGPLEEERPYGWNILAVSGVFDCCVFAAFWYNDHHWHWAQLLSGISLASFVVGLYSSKLVIVAQRVV